jgi:hypothetical protein
MLQAGRQASWLEGWRSSTGPQLAHQMFESSHLASVLFHVQYLSQIPDGPATLLEEIKQNTHHYISVIADAADSQLAMLTTTGAVPADVYDNLRETVSCCCCQLVLLHVLCVMHDPMIPSLCTGTDSDLLRDSTASLNHVRTIDTAD